MRVIMTYLYIHRQLVVAVISIKACEAPTFTPCASFGVARLFMDQTVVDTQPRTLVGSLSFLGPLYVYSTITLRADALVDKVTELFRSCLSVVLRWKCTQGSSPYTLISCNSIVPFSRLSPPLYTSSSKSSVAHPILCHLHTITYACTKCITL